MKARFEILVFLTVLSFTTACSGALDSSSSGSGDAGNSTGTKIGEAKFILDFFASFAEGRSEAGSGNNRSSKSASQLRSPAYRGQNNVAVIPLASPDSTINASVRLCVAYGNMQIKKSGEILTFEGSPIQSNNSNSPTKIASIFAESSFLEAVSTNEKGILGIHNCQNPFDNQTYSVQINLGEDVYTAIAPAACELQVQFSINKSLNYGQATADLSRIVLWARNFLSEGSPSDEKLGDALKLLCESNGSRSDPGKRNRDER